MGQAHDQPVPTDWPPPVNGLPTCTPTSAATGHSSVQPLLVGTKEAARLCGVSLATWHRLNAASKVPKPMRLGGRVLWSMDSLRLFVQLGCPDRRMFEALQASARK
jgi:prophage regulatory protein